MWRELELKIRTLDIFKNYQGNGNILLSSGNKNTDIMVIFNDIKNDALLEENIYSSDDGDKVKKILNYVGIDEKKVYTTSLYKLEKKLINLSNIDKIELLEILLTEIMLINPKYIITFGEEVFNIIVSYFNDRDVNKINVNMQNVVGNMYDFNSTILIPIYDIEYISRASKIEKTKIANILRSIKK